VKESWDVRSKNLESNSPLANLQPVKGRGGGGGGGGGGEGGGGRRPPPPPPPPPRPPGEPAPAVTRSFGGLSISHDNETRTRARNFEFRMSSNYNACEINAAALAIALSSWSRLAPDSECILSALPDHRPSPEADSPPCYHCTQSPQRINLRRSFRPLIDVSL
jgi:hypothetical protein